MTSWLSITIARVVLLLSTTVLIITFLVAMTVLEIIPLDTRIYLSILWFRILSILWFEILSELWFRVSSRIGLAVMSARNVGVVLVDLVRLIVSLSVKLRIVCLRIYEARSLSELR